jgi:hypothetical protein
VPRRIRLVDVLIDVIITTDAVVRRGASSGGLERPTDTVEVCSRGVVDNDFIYPTTLSTDRKVIAVGWIIS